MLDENLTHPNCFANALRDTIGLICGWLHKVYDLRFLARHDLCLHFGACPRDGAAYASPVSTRGYHDRDHSSAARTSKFHRKDRS